MKRKVLERIWDYVMMTVGCILFAAGISIFIDPYNLAPGGTTGIGIIISYLTNIQTGTLIFIMNIPLLIFGWIKFGTKFIVSTIYVTTLSSFLMNIIDSYLLPVIGLVTENVLLAGAAGGAIFAAGMGIIFKHGGTTGGSDIIVRAVRQKHPHLKTGRIYLISDFFIILASAFVFKNIENALYAVVTIVVSNFVLDRVLYGGDHAHVLYVISRKADVISNRILEEVDVGVTKLHGEGGYTGKAKNVLMIVVKNYNYSKVRNIIREEDKEAFLIVSNASEVFGDGYKDHYMQEI